MKILALPLTLIFALIISNIIAWASFVWTYNVFTHEEPIMVITFEKGEGREYLAKIESPWSLRGEYLIQGEQWRIDARFIKIKYWANLLGLESRHSLDRLQGRYISVQDENSLPSTAHQLSDSEGSHFAIFGWSPFLDIEYGSSTYQAIDPKKKFTVFKTPTGIITRAEAIVKADDNNWLQRLWQ
ncbi:MAG: hypothetical protein ACN6PH_17835 [Pseudomonas sp.]|jgi:hypothetical protein|uniref:hypothetical protein n=1 Tax=Pseudomonas sp. FME51 TaxID=2742609 RepID=UPI0015C77AE8|nr:hypothetical protein [Pseudomonas sp. FME51]